MNKQMDYLKKYKFVLSKEKTFAIRCIFKHVDIIKEVLIVKGNNVEINIQTPAWPVLTPMFLTLFKGIVI